MILISAALLSLAVTRAPEVSKPLKPGDTYPAGDGCNTCTVLSTEGMASCTLALCGNGYYDNMTIDPMPSIVWEPSAEAAARVLARLEDAEQRLQQLEQLRRDLHSWPIWAGVAAAGAAADLATTGHGLRKGFVEANPLGQSPDERGALKLASGVAVILIDYGLRVHHHVNAAKVFTGVYSLVNFEAATRNLIVAK